MHVPRPSSVSRQSSRSNRKIKNKTSCTSQSYEMDGWMDHARSRSIPFDRSLLTFFQRRSIQSSHTFPIDPITSFGRVIWRKEGNRQQKKYSDWIGTLYTPQLIFLFSCSAYPLSITYPSTVPTTAAIQSASSLFFTSTLEPIYTKRLRSISSSVQVI
jgi:hypothetical protein